MKDEDDTITECCGETPRWAYSEAAFNAFIHILECPKCFSCCRLDNMYNLLCV